jgi:DNA-binding HxlR family transcriptional regulator
LVVKIIKKSKNAKYKLSEFGNPAIPIIFALKKWSLGRKNKFQK